MLSLKGAFLYRTGTKTSLAARECRRERRSEREYRMAVSGGLWLYEIEGALTTTFSPLSALPMLRSLQNRLSERSEIIKWYLEGRSGGFVRCLIVAAGQKDGHGGRGLLTRTRGGRCQALSLITFFAAAFAATWIDLVFEAISCDWRIRTFPPPPSATAFSHPTVHGPPYRGL